MRHKLIDLTFILAVVAVVLIGSWILMRSGPSLTSETEVETEAPDDALTQDAILATEMAHNPRPTEPVADQPDADPIQTETVAPEPAKTEEPQTPYPDYVPYNPDIPLPATTQYILWQACEDSGIEYAVALAVIEVESDFDPNEDNGLCYGYMQLNRRYFPDNLSPGQNIRYGMEHLGSLLKKYGTIEAALTAYNAGHDTGSRIYANTVLAAAEKWREIV